MMEDSLFQPLADPLDKMTTGFDGLDHAMSSNFFDGSDSLERDSGFFGNFAHLGQSSDLFGNAASRQKDRAGSSPSSKHKRLAGSSHSQSYSNSYVYTNMNGKEDARQREERCHDGKYGGKFTHVSQQRTT